MPQVWFLNVTKILLEPFTKKLQNELQSCKFIYTNQIWSL